MREQLLGYLLDALEPHEREAVEDRLLADPQLREELEILYRSLDPLRGDKESFEPPAGLADRTCEMIAVHAAVSLAPVIPAPSRSSWSLADMIVAAGLFLAASMLLFPAVSRSRYNAQLIACQENLRQLGLSLANYSSHHAEVFPEVATSGNLGTAGVYATKLVDEGYLTQPASVVCPASPLAGEVDKFHVPSLEELRKAQGSQLAELQRMMGGSYGYSLGYTSDGNYRTTRNLHRPTFAVMADEPSASQPHYASLNHGGCGQNVLFEDGHVGYLTNCTTKGCRDEIFVNDQNQVAAGVHQNDAVIGASPARPIVTPVSIH